VRLRQAEIRSLELPEKLSLTLLRAIASFGHGLGLRWTEIGGIAFRSAATVPLVMATITSAGRARNSPTAASVLSVVSIA